MLPQTLLGRQLRLIGNDLRRGKTTLEELDRMSLAKALSKNGVSKRAIRLIDISLNYNSIDTVSAGGVMQDVERRRSAGTVPLRLKGGNDSFVNALGEAATEAGARISLNSRVESISQNTRDVKIRYIGPKGELKTIVADRVVCSLPFSVLQGISVTPGLSFGKSSAINEVAYTRSTKVFFQAKYAEWDKRSLGSSVWTDTPLERIFSSTGRLGDEKALFTAWAEGDGSKVLESMPDVERRRYAAAEFVKILPFMKDSIEKTHSHSWTLDPFARGAYFHYKVGQLNRFQDLMHKPAGRLHFAGEHTAIKMPGMEGALESADRVVEEISGVPVKV
ncbi:MAG: FAD-dependent oxidoreductase [Pyrinomonadaceae bacterium]|nr:FAD-dependent oxidoreductase [Pyrinomonadaceae bacterium]